MSLGKSKTLLLTVAQMNILSKFHIDNLRRFQSLPSRTAICAVYLLLGAWPTVVELHKDSYVCCINL